MIGDDELTAAELAYFNSGGKDTSGLDLTPPEGEEGTAGTPSAEAPAPAPAPEPEAVTESSASDDDDDDDVTVIVGKDGKERLKGKDGKFVSHQALHKEREKRKAVSAERDDLRVKLARGEERLAILNEAFNGQAAPTARAAAQDPLTEEPIDPTADFMGAMSQVQRQQKALQDRVSQSQQTQSQRDTFATVKQVYHNDARAFMGKEPNFEPAYVHLVSGRRKELEAMGVSNPAERDRMIAQEESQLVTQALQNKMSPAQTIYQVAPARGFVPGPKPATNGANGAATGQRTAAQDKIAQVRAGQAAADTLSGAGGAGSEGLTFDRLASMGDDEFASAVDGMSKAQIERILGRA